MYETPGTNDLAGRSVLVTGASGFIGSHVARRLVAAGAVVHALLRPSRSLGALEDLESRITVHVGDVTNYQSIFACLQAARPSMVMHFAADTTVRRFTGAWDAVERSVWQNLYGTINMLRGVLEPETSVSVFLRTGGLEEYGTGDVPFDELQRELPTSPYSASQVAGTHYSQMLQQYTTASIITLRPALIYGPGQATDYFIPSLILSCLRGTDFEMTAGTQSRDLLFIDDFVDAVVRTVSQPQLDRAGLGGTVLNVGGGQEYRIRHIAEEILRLSGANIRIRFGSPPSRSHDLEHLVASTQRARELLQWVPQYGLEEGLKRTIDWYRHRLSGMPA